MIKVITVKGWMVEIINKCKESEEYDDLSYILTRKASFKGWSYPLNDMTVEEIVLVWHGHAEVK